MQCRGGERTCGKHATMEGWSREEIPCKRLSAFLKRGSDIYSHAAERHLDYKGQLLVVQEPSSSKIESHYPNGWQRRVMVRNVMDSQGQWACSVVRCLSR